MMKIYVVVIVLLKLYIDKNVPFCIFSEMACNRLYHWTHAIAVYCTISCLGYQTTANCSLWHGSPFIQPAWRALQDNSNLLKISWLLGISPLFYLKWDMRDVQHDWEVWNYLTTLGTCKVNDHWLLKLHNGSSSPLLNSINSISLL